MRVGFDARWYNHSGVGTYVHELVKAVLEFVPTIDLLVYEYEANPLRDVGRSYSRRVVRQPKYSIAGQFEMASWSVKDKLDVFHSPFYLVPFMARCPIVVTIHDLMPFMFRIYNWPHQLLVKLGYLAGARRATRIITDSRCTAADATRLLGLPEDKIDVIRFGPSPRFSEKRADSDRRYLAQRYGIQPPYVLTLSATNWKTKNIHIALRGMLAASQTGIAFQPVVVGSEAGLIACRDEVGRLNPIITGYVPSEDLPVIYRNAEVFVCASAYEGLGLPVLEAMASGCAVIASTGGSLPEVAGQGAVLVPTGDPSAIARAICRLLSDEAEKCRLQNNGIQRAADFSWREVALQTKKVYEAACP